LGPKSGSHETAAVAPLPCNDWGGPVSDLTTALLLLLATGTLCLLKHL